MKPFIKKFEEVGMKDIADVGGKNASLGEMIQNLVPKGINIPSGYIITASAYRYFLETASVKYQVSGKLKEKKLKNFVKDALKGLDTKNLNDLVERGETVRQAIKNAEFPDDLKTVIILAHKKAEEKYGKNSDFAVRSSATAEDMPGASFAGQMETYLNIRGEENILKAVKAAIASLFTNRAISYRTDKGFDYFNVALSVGVQKMVRSDLSCSGILFTLDTESGFSDVILINGSWGLGEMIVQGEVTPDEFLIFKPKIDQRPVINGQRLKPIIGKELGMKRRKMIYGEGNKSTKIVFTSQKERKSFILSDNEILQLAKWGVLIEEYYSKKNNGKWTPMDLEWAKDGKTNKLFIVQARPETVHALRDLKKIKEYVLDNKSNEEKEKTRIIVRGASVGSKIAVGKARIILDAKKIKEFKAGEILVTDMTDPDWEPIMKIASAIVTDKGGRTSHAAIVSRELGIPCIVGSEIATKKIKTGQIVTVDTTDSEGLVFNGALKFKIIEHNVKKIIKPKTKIMMNIATPGTAFEKSFLPNEGVGLAREEFIIASDIGIHPNLIIDFEKMQTGKFQNSKLKKIIKEVEKRAIGWEDKKQFYIDKLAFGIAKIAAAFYPKPVIVRFSDFKTNEYRSLIGGELYEPEEENPMLGWRGASRYYHPNFEQAFILEVKAINKVREEMGLDNVEVMIPFCRTVEEGKKVLKIMESSGLKRNINNKKSLNSKFYILNSLKVYVMCEIPANVILADEFLEIFDGMSIGSNDLTQLTVGIDRDGNEQIRGIANEKDESVKKLITEVIKKCRAKKKYIGICGQAPSDFPKFAEFLVEQGIESISLNPDTVIRATQKIYEKERKLKKK